MDIIPDKRKIVSLVEQAHDGKVCLPNFQRDFVWRRDEVADLLRSMLRRYYIGHSFYCAAIRRIRRLHQALCVAHGRACTRRLNS